MDLIENFEGELIQHWYYKYKYERIYSYLCFPETKNMIIADVGAGSAVFSREIQKEHPLTSVYAIDSGYTEKNLIESTTRLKFVNYLSPDVKPDVVLMNDVLEHVEDDSSLLRFYVERVERNTHFIITVPAMDCLWSGHDVYLGHYRRYSKRKLLELIDSSGLVVEDCHYMYGSLFPAAFIRKVLIGKKNKSQLKQNNQGVNKFLSTVLILDKKISIILNIGVSLIASCRKE